jgi:DNA-3-methyladenine glycosylase II
MTLMEFTDTFTLKPVPPFSLELTAQIFCSGDPHVRSYLNGEFQQVLKVEGNLILAKVSSVGAVEKPLLNVELKSNKPITGQNKHEAQETIKHIFNLDFDLCSFYKEAENDNALKQITRQLCGFKFLTTPTVFESLVDAIVEQQISIKVARTIEERLAKKFGDKLENDGECYFAFPSPRNIVDASISDIQQVGLSKRKAEYIYGAAKLIVDGKLDLEEMKNEADAQRVIAELDEVKGIGVWTAELTILRGLPRWDVLPADDFGIRRVISTYYCGGSAIKAAEAREIAGVWGKWVGLAAFYLILAEVKGIVV